MDRAHGSNRCNRRQLVQGAGVAGAALLAGCGRLPWQAPAPAKVLRIGWIVAGTATVTSVSVAPREAFRQGLRELGYVEGQHYVIEYRTAEFQTSRLPELAAELIALPVDVLVTSGTPAAEAARGATGTIPIVMVYPGDPVANGVVASLARPGSNVTGLTEMFSLLGPKRLELLKEAVPGLSRAALMQHPDVVPAQDTTSLRDAAGLLQVQLQVLAVRELGDLDAAFESASRAGAEGISWGSGLGFRSAEYQSRVLALAAEYRLPLISGFPEWVEAGGLMAYATNFPALFRRAAAYVDKIVKGTKPADLPVEQPREFEFVINLRTARALGLVIPEQVLLQATEVIQ